jgi:hypothetical protein
MTPSLAPAAIQTLLAKLLPEADADTLKRLGQDVLEALEALEADANSPLAQALWAKLELLTGQDIRAAVFQAMDVAAEFLANGAGTEALVPFDGTAAADNAARSNPSKNEAEPASKDARSAPESFGASLLRALADGAWPSVSNPTEAAAGQGDLVPVAGFATPDAAAGGPLLGLSADVRAFVSASLDVQSATGSLFNAANLGRASGTVASSVMVSQASGMFSLGVAADITNAALTTPFVTQLVTPDGGLSQQLDTAGQTTYLGSASNAALNVGAARIDTAVLPPPAVVAVAPAASSNPPAGLLTVDRVDVNEGSPFAVFTVTGTPSQLLRLALGNTQSAADRDAVLGTDVGVALQIFNGSQWVDYAPGSLVNIPNGGNQLLVRTRVLQDDLPQGAKTFTLTATNVDALSASGIATIRDDGTGALYPDAAPVGNVPTTDLISARDDDRPLLSVRAPVQVSEGGFAVSTLVLDRPLDRSVTLELSLGHLGTEVGDVGPDLLVFTDPTDPVGSALVLTNGRFTLPPGVTTVYVRAAIAADNVYESEESFSITAGFVDSDLKYLDPTGVNTTPRIGASATGTGTVTDDGSGTVYGPGGLPLVGTPAVDERPTLSVSGQTNVSEGSPATFTLTLSRATEQPTEIELALANISTEPGDTGAISVFTDPADPVGSAITVTNGRFTLPPGVTAVYASVATTADGVYEGLESFSLTAGFTSTDLTDQDPTGANTTARTGATATAVSTVTDDGTGTVYGPGGLPAVGAPSDERPAISVSSPVVNEAAGYAVFTVSLNFLSTEDLHFLPMIGTTGVGTGHATTGDDMGATGALEYSADGGQTWLTASAGVTIAAGSASVLVRTTVLNDQTPLYEGPETFALRTGAVTVGATATLAAILNPQGAVGTTTITDDGTGSVPTGTPADDDRPTLTARGNTVLEDGGWSVFTVELDRPSGLDIQFAPYLTGGTALVADDTAGNAALEYFSSVSSTWVSAANGVTIAAGQTSVTLRVQVTDDLIDESTETLNLVTGPVDGVTQSAGTTGVALIVDNDPSFAFDSQAVTVTEGEMMNFIVRRVSGAGVAVTLDWSVLVASSDSSALPVLRTGTVSFAANQDEATIGLPSVDEQRITDDQRLYLSLSTADGDIRITQGTVSAVVQSNDAEIGIRSITVTGPDANGLFTYEVTVERSGALGFNHSVTWGVAGVGENPASLGDFVLPAGMQVNFTPNTTSGVTTDTQTFTFQARAGLVIEGERTFEVTIAEEISTAAQVQLGRDASRGTITPNGAAVTIEAVTTNLIEGSASGDVFTHTFRINLSQVVGSDVVLNWSVASFGSNTAVDANAADFGGTLPSGSVTILAGQTSALVQFAPSPDSELEPGERFLVDFSVQSGPAGKVGPAAVGRIANDESSVQFAFTNYAANEGDIGADGTLLATVLRSDFVRSTASVSWHVEAVTGVTDAQALAYFTAGQNAGNQSSGLPSGTVTLQPGQVQSDIVLRLVGDDLVGAVRYFQIVLDNPSQGTTLGAHTLASAAINDDDARFEMVSQTLVHEEGSGGANYTEVEVSRIGDTRLAAAVTWTALGTGANPTNATDLLPNNSAGTLLFAAGEASARIRINLRPDDAVEANEQFTVLLTGTNTAHHRLGSALSTVVTVNNDDASVSFDPAAANLTQVLDEDSTGLSGAVFSFQVTRTGDTRNAVDVPWTIPLLGSLTTDDFVAISGVAQFAAGSSTATVTVTATSDRLVEADETFDVVLAPAVGSGLSLGVNTTANGTLTNNDVRIDAALVGARTEGADGATSTYTFTLSRVGDVGRQASDVNWSVAGSAIVIGSVTYAAALSSGEFAGTTTGNLTWAAGNTSTPTVTITVNNDTAVEGDEAFALSLASNGSDRSDLRADGTVAVVHDDDTRVSIARLSPATVTEGAQGSSQAVSFRVTRDGDLSSTLTVDLLATGVPGATGPTAVTFNPQTSTVSVTLANGQTQQLPLEGGQQFVDVTYVLPGDDFVQGSRNFSVALSNPQTTRITGQADQTAIDSSAASATVAVRDDDDLIVATASTPLVVEGDSGTVPVSFTLARSGDTSGTTVVNWRIVPGAGLVVDANDFQVGQEDLTVPNGGMPSGRLTFAPGQTAANVTVYVSGDTAIEGDENLALNLDVVAGNSELVGATVTVLTDDAGFNVLARAASVVEGNTPGTPNHMTFDVIRAGTTGSSTVNWALTGITLADIEDVEINGVSMGHTLSGSIAYSGSQSGAVVRVRLVQDQVAETDENVTLTVTDPANSNATLGTASSLLVNDDAALSISAALATVNEGSDSDIARVVGGNPQTLALTFTVTRTGNITQATSADWSVLAQGGVDANDFAGGVLPTSSLNFAMGETSKIITLHMRQDWQGEANELVTVALSNASPGTQLLVGTASTTVVNDDASIGFTGHTLQGSALALAEGDNNTGFVTYTFTVTRSGNTSREQEVGWRVASDDTHLNVADFFDSYFTPGAGSTTRTLPYGTVIFVANDPQTSKTITVRVNSDTFATVNGPFNTIESRLETDEPFRVELTNPQATVRHVGYSVPTSESTAYASIVNDDVRIEVRSVQTNLPEGRDPSLNGGDVNPQEAGVQRWITHAVTVGRSGDPTQAVSFQWYIDTPGLADRFVLANGSGNLPNGTWGINDGTAAAGIASGSYAAAAAVGGVSRGELSGLLRWAVGDMTDRVLYFTPQPNDTPEGDFSVMLKARPNPAAPTESAIIDEFGAAGAAVNRTLAGGLELAGLVVRRDEAELWISNAIHRSYNATTSSWRDDDNTPFAGQVFKAGLSELEATANVGNTNDEGTVLTAAAGADYTAKTGTLTFNNGARTQTVTVALSRDQVAEERETFSLRLDDAVNASGASEQTNVTLVDGDGTSRDYSVAVNNATAIEGVDGYAQFRVDFGKPLSQTSTFALTMSGTALQDSKNGLTGDYFRHVEVSSDGGQTWQSTAPTLGFNVSVAQAEAQARTVQAVYGFNNDRAPAERFDAWLDFSDLKAGAGYKVGGGLANLAFGAAAPPPLDTSGRLYVVVEEDGAYVDTNNDGIRSFGENTLAFDPSQLVGTDGGTGGMAWKDLINLGSNAVTIKFNAIPNGIGTPNQLALNMMGNDDIIQIDLRAMAANGLPVGTDDLQVTTSASFGRPNHPAFTVRQNDVMVSSTSDGIQYSATLKGYRNAYEDGPPVDHSISIQFGNGARINLGQLGLGYGAVSQVLAGQNFDISTSNGLLDQMSFVNPISTPRAEIWIPVGADAVIDPQALGLAFSGVPAGGVARGAFVGVADLSSASTINEEALAHFRELVANPNATLANIQEYFNRFDPNNILPDGVKFLKFQIEWDRTGSPTWTVQGLDAALVVAPQDGEWDNLALVQDVTLAAGQTTASAAVQLGNTAAFTSPTSAVGDGNGGITPAQPVVELVARSATSATLTATGTQLGWDGTITAAAGADSILVRAALVNDRIDEIVENINVTVRPLSGDTFIGTVGSGRITLVDDDSPQITVGTAVVRDASRSTDYLTKVIDINNRGTASGIDTPDLLIVNNVNGSSTYVSESQLHNMGAGQAFAVAVRYKGSWEVAAFSEIMQSSFDPIQFALDAGHHHGSSPVFRALQGTAEVVNGQPTGFYLAQIAVPAGTYQLLMRSPVETIARALISGESYGVSDLTPHEQARADSIGIAVGHVAPVIVARAVSANEADGQVQIEVIAVGGDFSNGAATVDYATVDGAWTERTFVISRELTSKGAITVTWALDSPDVSDLPEGPGRADYVPGYFKSSSIVPSTRADFIALDGQLSTATGVRGQVTFADGQKEALITIRVRSDDVIEATKDFRVQITGEVINGVAIPIPFGSSETDSFKVIPNPEAPALYQNNFGSAGFGRIANDDRVFTITGFVFKEGVHGIARRDTDLTDGDAGMEVATSKGLALPLTLPEGVSPNPSTIAAALLAADLLAPAGYTLHQFVINLEGAGAGAASVQWRLFAAGTDVAGFDVGPQNLVNGRPVQSAERHLIEAADFLLYDVAAGDYASAMGFDWVAANVGPGQMSVPKTVFFANGQTQAVITIALRDDVHVEDAEGFRIELLNPQALQGSTGAVDVHPLRGEAQFLVADNDGGTVRVEFGSMPALDSTRSSLVLLADDSVITEGSGGFYGAGAAGSSGWQLKSQADWITSGGPYPGIDSNLADDRRVVLVFTRENADTATASQAFFEIKASISEAIGLTIEEGNVQKMPDEPLWRGTVDFLPNETKAYVVLRLNDDLLIEASSAKLTVTLYDAETLPTTKFNTIRLLARDPGWDDGIGSSGPLADWNLTRRDPNAYTASINIRDDDARVWFGPQGGDVRDYAYDHDLDANTGSLTLGLYDLRAVAYEGNSAWSGPADQAAAGGNGSFAFKISHKGAVAGTITMGWEVVLSGTATAADFNASLFNTASTYVNTDGKTVLVALAPLSISAPQIADELTKADGSPVVINGLFAPNLTVDANRTFELVLATPVSSTGNSVLYSADGIREPGAGSTYPALPQLRIAVTIANDDVAYSVAWNATDAPVGNAPATVLEGDTDIVTSNLLRFDVSRAVGDFTAGSSVGWRVVQVTGSNITADDFADIFMVNGQPGLPFGTVTFSGRTTNANGTTLLAAQLVETVELRIRGDNAVELGEHFRIELYNPSIGFVNQSANAIEGIIVNDDTGLRVETTSVSEGDSGDQMVTVTVTRYGDLVRANKTDQTSEFDWSVVDVDTRADDHGTGPTTGTGVQMGVNNTAAHTYGYAQETTTFTYNMKGDAEVEANEAMLVLLSGVTGVDELHDQGRGTVTILNDDTVFSVETTAGYASSNLSVVEDVGGAYHFRITRSVSVPQDQTVTWSVVSAGGRNVVDAADFGGVLPSGTVTFAPGEFFKDITFSSVSADVTVETDEVFTVEVTAFGAGAENDSFVTTGDGAIGKILSDEQAVFIGDSLPVTQPEGTGSDVRTYRFEVVRAGSTSQSTSSVDWALNFTGTGADASDFTGPTSGTVTFTQDGSQIVSVTIAADAMSETTLQDFNILLSNGTGGAQILRPSARGIIGDDDYALAVAAASTAEGDGNSQIAFTVTRTGSSALAASVNWTLDFVGQSANAADFRAIGGSFTVPAGVTSYTFYVPIQGDTQWETNETFNVMLDYGVGTASAVGTLLNDDEGFSIAAITPVLESAGTVTFRVNRDGNLTGSSTVEWNLAGSGAEAATTSGAGNDFSGPLSGSLTFADAETHRDVSVTLVNDTVREANETFTVTLVNPGPGSSIKPGADGSAIGTVLNDDQGYTLSASDVSVAENASAGAGGTVTFTVTRAITTGASSVVWALSNPSGDATAVALADLMIDGAAATSSAFSGRTLNFAVGEATKTIALSLTSDATLESQALLRIALSRATGDVVSTLITPTADVHVIDDDERLSLVSMSLLALNEGDSGSTPIAFKVTRDGSSIGAASATWTLAGAGNNPLNAADIDRIEIDGVAQSAGALTGTLTFADASLVDRLITVYVRGDTIGEFDEAFTLTLTNPSTGTSLGSASATHTVQNDDPAVQLVMATTQFAEGNDGDDRAITFQVVRTGSLSLGATVGWNLMDAASGSSVNAGDFGGSLPTGLVTFQAGESVKTVTVLTAGDDVWEPNEGFRIALGNPSVGTTVIGPATLVGTLMNDDVQVTITAAGGGTVIERQAGQTSTAQFTLAAQGLLSATSVLVSWRVEGVGLNPTNGADFVGGVLPTGQTSIPVSAGAGTASLLIDIAGDNTHGPNEQFKVVIDSITVYNGSNVVGGGNASVPSATMTVRDDDILIGLSQAETHRVLEGDTGTITSLRFYVDQIAHSADAATMADVRVDFRVSGDVSAGDLTGATGSNAALAFDAASGRYYIGVDVNGDALVEGTERFTLHLDGARTVAGGGVEVAQSGATVQGQILDDDFGIELVSSTLVQAEDSARFVFDVLRTGPTDEAMAVQWKLGNPVLASGEWGVSANDFLDPATGQPYVGNSMPLTGQVVFNAGQSTARFTLEASHDTLPEANERFAVQVSVTELGGVALTAQPHQIDMVVGVITYDELLPLGFDPAIDQQIHQPLNSL